MLPRRGDPSKKYSLAKTSLLFQTKEFFTNSTLHGVRYIAEKGRPFFDKFLWLCCTSVGATVTLIIIVSLWEKFQTNPTITGLDTDFHNWDVPFPGVSLCQGTPVDEKRVQDLIAKNFSNVDQKDILHRYLTIIGSINRRRMVDLAEFSDISKYPGFPTSGFKDIAMEVAVRCEDQITNCMWKGEPISCCDVMFPIFTENGFCYTFNVDPSQGVMSWNSKLPDKRLEHFKQEFIYETDPKWAINVNVKNASGNPVYIYIHSSNEQPGLDLSPQHSWDERITKMAFSAKTTYTTEDALQLTIKQRRCVFPKEIKLLTEDSYTYGACMRECRMKMALKKCQCVPLFYKMLPKYPHCDFAGYQCIIKNIDDIMSKSVCACELCCDNTVYEVEKISEAGSGQDEQGLEISFVSWPMIRYKREVLFGWVDLLVSFGGIAGLFLGFSLLSGVEIIYYFTMRACCMVFREKEKLENLKKEYELEEKPPLDLSLTPYFMRKEEENGENPNRHIHHVPVQPYY